MRITGRHRLPAVLVLGTGLAFAALGPVAASTKATARPHKTQALLPITVSSSGVTGNSSPLYTGFVAGIYKKYGLQLTYQALTPTASAAAVLNGNVNIADDGPNIASGMIADPGAAKMIMTNGPTVGWVFCKQGTATAYTGKNVNDSMAGLKGLTIATTTPGGGTDTALHLGLKAAGLTVGQNVSIAYLSTNAGALSGVLSGKVQCAAESPPNSVQALQDGLVQVTSFSPWDAPSEWAVNESWAKTHRQTVVDFLKAFCAATRLSSSNKTIQEQGLETYGGITAPAQLLGTWQAYRKEWACVPYPVNQLQHFVLDNLASPTSPGQSVGASVNAKTLVDSSFWSSVPKSSWVQTALTANINKNAG
jgi:ABC-type nitrate/sulfonate/bicarbonate transport system substrate-binding protein